MEDDYKKRVEKQFGISFPALEIAKSLDKTNSMFAAAERIASMAAVKNYSLPDVIHAPPLIPPVKISTPKEQNEFQSAGVLLRALSDSIVEWRKEIPADADVQPVVVALLQGGVQIDVERLAQESFHGIRIEGAIQGSPCIVLSHQATVQLLCFIQRIEPPERPRRPIGFVVDGNAWEA